MTQIRAVIFDLGHTVWDFAPRENVRRLNALRLHLRLRESLEGAVPSPNALDKALIATFVRWMKSWEGDSLEQPPSEELVREALATVDLAVPDALLRDLTLLLFGSEVDVPVIEPDTLAALDRLDRRGIAMGCVTNTILLEEAIAELLAKLGLRRYLQSYIVSSNTDYRKPHPSLFLRALDELGVPPEEALFVGDRLVDDIGGAQGVGMRAVLTHQYRQEPLEGAARAPDAVVRRLGELPDVIERMEANR
ncbi:MAG: HAD family hydrolase [Chloroflexi bacterium]|nr:HAD family hydrolase [Chloroflexota bacterium]